MKPKKVYLVGSGPGKPDLITVRGLGILKEADVVIYDYLVDKRFLDYAKRGAELVCCDELGKKRYSNGFLMHQEKINNLIVRKSREGKKVIRLKNGDASIFGRYSQELNALIKEKIEFEVVPGVTAASAAAALSGIPLTDRRFASSCVFVTGNEDPAKKKSLINWNALSKSGTIVLYMAVENLDSIVKKIVEAGRDKNTDAAIIENVSLPAQRTLTGTLKDIAAKAKKCKVMPPAVIIIGRVAKHERRFNWLKKKRRILFTGLSRERFFESGTYFHLPLIKIEPLKDYRAFDRNLMAIRSFDWIVFASRYGVKYFFERLKSIGCDTRVLSGIKIAAIGNSTKSRLLDFGIIADLVPKRESSKGLLEEFKKIDLKGKKIFLPRSDIADKGLGKAFERLGARAISSLAYRNVMPKALPDLDLNFFNEIMFTSPSTVRNFKKRYSAKGGKKIPKQIKVRCIGEVTLREAKKCRLLN